jgi:phosphatidylinositol glycan class W
MDEPDTYKLRKEAFVSNLTGGTITEINYITAIAPVRVDCYLDRMFLTTREL